MSNFVGIESTIFVNPHTGEKDYGVRIFDNYSKDYSNTWEEAHVFENDGDILRRCVYYHIAEDIFDYVFENDVGVHINGTFYSSEEIKDMLG